jgi:hypothetical protein
VPAAIAVGTVNAYPYLCDTALTRVDVGVGDWRHMRTAINTTSCGSATSPVLGPETGFKRDIFNAV